MLIKSNTPSWALSRRSFLRGSLGTAVALPFLDAMSFDARAQAAAAPRRFMAFYVPCGMHMAAFTPQNEGDLAALPRILEPLEAVKQHTTVVTGLRNRAGDANEDGAGDHARGTGTFLTATRLLKSDVNIRNNISLDQVMANHLRNSGYAGLPSLEVGCEGGGSTGNCDSGYSCAYVVNVAWGGAQQPLPKETNPRAVFDRLFAGTDPTETRAEIDKRKRYRQSVLDVVKGDAARLSARLGTKDRQKLDQHLTGVRELERRLDSEEVSVCTPGPRPDGPSGDPTAYIRAMLDLIVNAYACDQTRVATFMLGNGGSNRNFNFIGVNAGHHEASHHQNDPARFEQIQRIDRWEVEQFAYLIDQMSRVDEGNGQTLLDSSLVFFSSEIEDGNSHSHQNLPIVLAGRGGGVVRPGRHVRAQGRSVSDLFVTALSGMQVPQASFADSGSALTLT